MQHGGDIYTEGILKGRELIDFSSNINPLGIPESFKKHIEEGIQSLNRYPDAKYRELKENLTRYINSGYELFHSNASKNKCLIEESNLVLGNGAAEIIDLVISCFESILIMPPSFGEYQEDAEKWGLNIFHLSMNENMEYDYKGIQNSIDKVQALIIGNPNNPNGGIIDKNKFLPILKYCEEKGKTVIIDEAFIEFTGNIENSFVEELENFKCIFVIRALTKFYAMPAIRLGFGISKNEEILNKIRKKQNPWNINCFAELAAKYVLKDKEYIKKSITWINEEKNYLPKELEKISYIEKVYKTYSNFVLCKLKGIDCDRLYELCIKEGIVIRKCDNFIRLDKSFVRFAIKDREKNELLIKKLNLIII
ncbi:pyridoxal phosphate-dependent aminotransferase [Clostridium lundense]|uniref:pyridoxal phosphate-dependent aminotransferase n=1 Tax=Clostridium lundense TaxID=319475 RepID=UPI00048959A1|nr:histidinol-phosphate transaminase [Clostridium lundense]